MLKTLARTTPLVKAVLLTKVIAVCVLLDSRVRLVMKVKRNAHQHSIVKCTIHEPYFMFDIFWGMGYCCAKTGTLINCTLLYNKYKLR